MAGSSLTHNGDHWAEWLRRRRTGASHKARHALLDLLAPVRDQILDGADLRAGDVLLDVGCGDGLVGLGALERGARVIFSDISRDCLDDCRALAGTTAEYLVAPATDLGDVEADAVTTRSVLIYVANKEKAFSEFFRVLRPGGRISIFEPINRFGMQERRRTYGFRDLDGVEGLVAKVGAEIDRVENGPNGVDPMIDFDERDLIRLAEGAGFEAIRLNLIAEVTNEPMWQTREWEVFVNSSPNPLAPTLREAMDAALTAEETAALTAVLRPQVEGGLGATRLARAFLTARKPSPV